MILLNIEIKNEIRWKDLSLPVKQEDLLEVESQINFIFPDDFREFILEFNEAQPDKNIINLIRESGITIQSFLSIRPEDEFYIPKFVKNDSVYFSKSLVPIAVNDSGNMFCYDRLSKCIMYYWHEIDGADFVANDLTEMLEMLQK